MNKYMISEMKLNNDIVKGIENCSEVTFSRELMRYEYKLNGEKCKYDVKEWKVLADDENYEVSRFGFIRRIGKDKALTPSKLAYSTVAITGKKRVSVHRVVITNFIGKEDNVERNEVNHKDEIKSNNDLFNLEWNTRLENVRNHWKISNKRIKYEDRLGMTGEGKDGKYEVVGFNRENRELIVEFNNTGNQRIISVNTTFDDWNIRDNNYIVTKPNGDSVESRKMNIFKEDGFISPRASDVLYGKLNEWNGYKIKHMINRKIIKEGE